MAQLLYISDEHKLTPDSITPVSSGEITTGKEWLQSKLRKEIHRGNKLRNINTTIPRQLNELRVLEAKQCHSPKNKNKKQIVSKRKPSIGSNRSGNKNKVYRNQKQCSTRITELAAPSKRRCIATWRSKCDNLPPLMLERLKRYINGELPVTKVSEALTCFDKPKKSKKRVKAKAYILVKDRQEIRKYCETFCGIVAQKLLTPLNISLEDSLKRLANVVNQDITKLMQKCIKQNNLFKKINQEISNKVTLWIIDILENSENIQLERDLKELDEEEGPVLDFVEDLIDDAVNTYNKRIEVEVQNKPSNKSISENTSFQSNKDISISSKNTLVKEKLPEQENNSSDIEDILEQNNSNIKLNKENISKTINNDSIITNKIDGITSQQLEKVENINYNNSGITKNKIDDKSEEDSQDHDEISSYSAANLDLDATEEQLDVSSYSSKSLMNVKKSTPTISESLASIQRKKITFSSPKPQLLTEADESWPNDIALPTLRISQSAVKSVTSLGNIYEKED